MHNEKSTQKFLYSLSISSQLRSLDDKEDQTRQLGLCTMNTCNYSGHVYLSYACPLL